MRFQKMKRICDVLQTLVSFGVSTITPYECIAVSPGEQGEDDARLHALRIVNLITCKTNGLIL